MQRTEIFQQEGSYLGMGSYGQVKVVEENGFKYAVKIISKDKIRVYHRERQLIREIQSMKKLRHENVVRFIQFDQNQTQYRIKMEICEGKNLQEFLLSESYLQDKLKFQSFYYQVKISLDLINALAQLKIHFISNRDIKPENNIVVQTKDGKVLLKMIDFGQAIFNIVEASTKVGTLSYMAPQVYFVKSYNQKCDEWSLGCEIYQIFTKPKRTYKNKYLACPFRQDFNPQKPQQFLKLYNEYIWQERHLQLRIPPPFRKIILGFLNVDPEKRMSLVQAFRILIQEFQYISLYLPQQDREKQLQKLDNSLIELKNSQLRKHNILEALAKLKISYMQVYKPLLKKIKYQKYRNETEFIKLLRFLRKKICQALTQLTKNLKVNLQYAFQDILVGIISSQQLQSVQRLLNKINNYLNIERIQITHDFEGINPQLSRFIIENCQLNENEQYNRIFKHIIQLKAQFVSLQSYFCK